MKKEKKGFLLKTQKQLNLGAAVSALGFLLFLLVSALNLGIVKDIVVVVCRGVPVGVRLSGGCPEG